MTILLYLVSLGFFTRFFYAIGIWYIGIIPLIIALITIVISAKDSQSITRQKPDMQKYSIYAAWLAMMIWFVGIATFFSSQTVHIWLWLIGINIIFWLLSYISKYTDGTYMGQLWYYVGILYVFWQVSHVVDWQWLGQVISLFWLLTLAIVWFIVGVIGYWKRIAKYMYYKLFVLFLWTIMIAIAYYVGDIYTVLLANSILILLLAIGLYMIHRHHTPSNHEIKNISVRRILAGERINKNKHIPSQSIVANKLHLFLSEMPLWTRYIIEAANCILVIITIWLYLQNIADTTSQWHQIVYWLIVWLFIATALVLKRIWYTSVMQKITLFAVINYAIYLTLYTVLGSIGAIVWWGIVRNIASSILLFYAPSSFLAEILCKQDYQYWIVMTIIALCINIYLLWLTNLHGQLVFSIVFVYIGLQGLLLYYGLLHIQQLE